MDNWFRWCIHCGVSRQVFDVFMKYSISFALFLSGRTKGEIRWPQVYSTFENLEEQDEVGLKTSCVGALFLVCDACGARSCQNLHFANTPNTFRSEKSLFEGIQKMSPQLHFLSYQHIAEAARLRG